MTMYRNVGNERIELTAEEEAAQLAEWAANEEARQTAEEAREAKRLEREAKLEEIPADVNSVPALRARVNDLISIVRELTDSAPPTGEPT